MSFLSLILRNLFRHRVRSLLTIVGISIGIATIVTLGLITEGLKSTVEEAIKAGKADFSIAQAGVVDLILSTIKQEELQEIQKMKGIKNAVGVLIASVPVSFNPYFIAIGINQEDIKLGGININEGRIFKKNSQDEIILGKVAAKNFRKKTGEEIQVGPIRYKIVGIFETGNVFQDGGAFLPLRTLQKLQRKEHQVTMILVEVKEGVDIAELARQVEKKFQGDLIAITSASEYKAIDQGLAIVNVASWAISLLAIVIGGIGVMNTIMMSVFERTREIGILRALGWRRKRVLALILGESFLIGIGAVLLGIILGIVAIQLILLVPAASSFLKPSYSLIVFERAILVGILVSLVGGLYPAYRATKFSPTEALRHE
ncbi:ABC transporter permease [Candidatus Aerophobetes bacterium]|uniref:ABC transporter permease n=1 Tax=Aerophobetes bacterium TaxID=2030807 RepID=A0A523VZX5_UNCAE|nr:MAG: ABC transporter permease [Candidatus Aerophobetes bacterium]